MERRHRHESDDVIDYPTGDGKPMAETRWHRQQMTVLIASLEQLLAGSARPVQVGGNEMFYWERGNARKSISPDGWVAFDLDVPMGDFDAFKLWVQGKGPDLVIESCSKSTRRNDFGKKKERYRRHFRVGEYVIWDVDHDEDTDALDIHGLYAWRLDALGRYQPVALDDDGAFVSQVLGGARLRFDPQSRFLRVVDTTGRVMPGTAQEGRREGQADGELRALRHAVGRVLRARFGELPPTLEARLDAITSAEELDGLLARAATVNGLDQL